VKRVLLFIVAGALATVAAVVASLVWMVRESGKAS
jgi:hypothetical protein